MTAARYYKDFWLSRTGGPDAPWIARHDLDGRKYRADTLKGLKQVVTAAICFKAVMDVSKAVLNANNV